MDGEDFLPLDVYFIHRNVAQSGTIMLPGDTLAESTSVSFTLHVSKESSAEEAIVVVLHKGRILEAAQLRGTVLADADAERSALEAFEFVAIAWLVLRVAYSAARSATWQSQNRELAGREIGQLPFIGNHAKDRKSRRNLYILDHNGVQVVCHGKPPFSRSVLLFVR